MVCVLLAAKGVPVLFDEDDEDSAQDEIKEEDEDDRSDVEMDDDDKTNGTGVVLPNTGAACVCVLLNRNLGLAHCSPNYMPALCVSLLTSLYIFQRSFGHCPRCSMSYVLFSSRLMARCVVLYFSR